jgi:hypothetical protein
MATDKIVLEYLKKVSRIMKVLIKIPMKDLPTELRQAIKREAPDDDIRALSYSLSMHIAQQKRQIIK